MGSLFLATAQLIFAWIPTLTGLSSEFKKHSLEVLQRWRELSDEKEETYRKKEQGTEKKKNRKRTGKKNSHHNYSFSDIPVKSEEDTDACHKDPEIKRSFFSDDKRLEENKENLPNGSEVKMLLEYISNVKSLLEKNIIIVDLLGQIISGKLYEENVDVIEQLCTCHKTSSDKPEDFEKLFSLAIEKYLVKEDDENKQKNEEHSSKNHSMKTTDESLDLLNECKISSISEKELKDDLKRKDMPGLTTLKNTEEGANFVKVECDEMKKDGPTNLQNLPDQLHANFSKFSVSNSPIPGKILDLRSKEKTGIEVETGCKDIVEMKCKIPNRDYLVDVTRNCEQGNEKQHQLEKENTCLTEQLRSLQIKYKEVLNELGKIMFEQAAEENEKRKSELFQQTFLFSSCKDKRFSADGKQIDSPKVIRTNGSSNFSHENNVYVCDDSSPVNSPIVSAPSISEQPVRVAKALVQKDENHLERGNDGDADKSIQTDRHDGKNESILRRNTSKSAINDLQQRLDMGREDKGRQGGKKTQATHGEKSITKRTSDFRSSSKYGTTSGAKDKENQVIQIEEKGPAGIINHLGSTFQHRKKSGKEEYENTGNQRKTKENKETGEFGSSSLEQRKTNGGMEKTNQENQEVTSTTKRPSDLGSSLQDGTISGGKSRENQENQGDTKKTKETSDSGSASRDENIDLGSIRRSYEGLSFSIQQDDTDGTDYISLSNVPPISVATTLYNNYKLLLMTLAEQLLSSDVLELTNWASQNFSIEISHNATDILFQLDQHGFINASNLFVLCDFFESIVRFDLVHIIDAFLLGDYSLLWQTSSLRRKTANEARRTNIQQITSPTTTLSNYDQLFARSSSVNENPVFANHHGNKENPRSTNITDNSTYSSGVLPYTNFTVNPNNLDRNHLQSTAQYEQQNFRPRLTRPIATGMTNTVVADHLVSSDGRTNRNSSTIGSNGFKLSKFQSPEPRPAFPGTSRHQATHDDQDINWLCSHYRRRCYVKFECCDKFWPCHRCHNNQSTCGRKKLKSRDTKMLKCVNCGKVQQFGEFCCECNIKFANYYCGLCKHLTGTDDHPFHCIKCGICRIHGDRSFHCDICGVCLDVQLRGNHKCREGSAHDECCICLEDAFTGCQILPCSHKVHKECANQMIRSGITRCPICRESFAHKLERRPTSGSRERCGK